MDNIDRKILAILQQDATVSVARISERIGLSMTPCVRRIKRLEASGVILQRVALLAPEKLGLGLTAFVLVKCSDHSAERSEQFVSAVVEISGVMDVSRMAGGADYMLRIVLPNIQSYDHFYKSLVAIVSIEHPPLRDGANQTEHGVRHKIVALLERQFAPACRESDWPARHAPPSRRDGIIDAPSVNERTPCSTKQA